jgi:hypothetical protein
MWMAFNMKGLGGLIVPEELISFDGRTGWTKTHNDPPIFTLRYIPQDGPVFESLDKCIAFCKKANEGNPFADM